MFLSFTNIQHKHLLHVRYDRLVIVKPLIKSSGISTFKTVLHEEGFKKMYSEEKSFLQLFFSFAFACLHNVRGTALAFAQHDTEHSYVAFSVTSLLLTSLIVSIPG
jgi:hypothetical protein